MPVPSAVSAAAAPTILLLPGLNNSGDGHWQTYWEQMLPTAQRVQQQDWDTPCRQDWVNTLDAAIQASNGPVVLAAHSLGCALVAWWVAEHGNCQGSAAMVKGALLVAPPDVERADFPASVRDFGPMPRMALPFDTIVVGSDNDSWCEITKIQSFSADWKATFHNIGALGHLNAASGLRDWQQGRTWLAQVGRMQSVV
ncbi:RBBP9/YdeN family alpha/beta hydrolase [Glaciimonas sp. GNP009]